MCRPLHGGMCTEHATDASFIEGSPRCFSFRGTATYGESSSPCLGSCSLEFLGPRRLSLGTIPRASHPQSPCGVYALRGVGTSLANCSSLMYRTYFVIRHFSLRSIVTSQYPCGGKRPPCGVCLVMGGAFFTALEGLSHPPPLVDAPVALWGIYCMYMFIAALCVAVCDC